MYPITKQIEKAMLPIRTTPAIDYIIKEALDVDVEKFIIVINEKQYNIKEYLTKNYSNLNFTFVYQNDFSGLGKAILYCESEIVDEYFYVALPDELFSKNILKKLKDEFMKYVDDVHLIAIKKVEKKDTKKYGIVRLKKDKIIYGIEKPNTNSPSRYAIVGRYLFNKKIFNYLKKYNDFEIGLSNVIFNNLDNDLFYSSIINCKRYDIGDKKGYIKAFNKMSDLK